MGLPGTGAPGAPGSPGKGSDLEPYGPWLPDLTVHRVPWGMGVGGGELCLKCELEPGTCDAKPDFFQVQLTVASGCPYLE